MCNAEDSLASRISIVRPFVASQFGAHFVMHVDVPDILVQGAIHRLPSGQSIVGMLATVGSLARLTHCSWPSSGRC